LIGPEGGFTPEEAAAAVEAGAVPATLGPRILRSETAAIAAAALALLA
jgi:16S rRNA (uracil1498-N3)-methyltransferase